MIYFFYGCLLLWKTTCTDQFLFFKLNLWFFSIKWQEKFLTHKKGVLELFKEQKFFTDSHIIHIIFGRWYFEYLLKTPLQSIAHFSYIENGFILFFTRCLLDTSPETDRISSFFGKHLSLVSSQVLQVNQVVKQSIR